MIFRLLNRSPAWSLAITAMASVQIGAAISVGLFDEVGIIGTAWLRLSIAALGFIMIARPRLTQWSFVDLRPPILLGLVSAVMTVTFLAAIDRLPLGTAVAIEFLGPLVVAAVHGHLRRMLVWPAVAFVGVVMMTEPWQGEPDLLGILLAATAGAGWGLYIVITQHVGDRFSGVDGLAVSVTVAAIATGLVGAPQALVNLSWNVFAIALGAALLLPLIPWTLELFALRRLTKSAFGTLMAIEPAIGLAVGAIILSQAPKALQLAGITFVVIAGVFAARGGDREAQGQSAT